MNFTISGHHLEVTQALQEHVRQKLATVLSHFNNVTSIDVTLTAERREHKAEDCRQKACTKAVMKGRDIHVVGRSGDMYVAIDSMMKRLDRALLAYKEQLQDHQPEICPKRGAAKVVHLRQ